MRKIPIIVALESVATVVICLAGVFEVFQKTSARMDRTDAEYKAVQQEIDYQEKWLTNMGNKTGVSPPIVINVSPPTPATQPH